MLRRITLVVCCFLLVVTAACTPSNAPVDDVKRGALTTAVPSLAGAPTIRDYIAQNPQLYNMIVGKESEEVTVVAQVLQSGGPVLLVLALDEPIPVIGQVDDVLILVIVAAGLVLYAAPKLGAITKQDFQFEVPPSSWEPVQYSNAIAALGLSAAFASMNGWVQADPSQFGLDMPPGGICEVIESLTGKPCEWEFLTSISENGEQLFQFILKSGERVIAEAQGMRVLLADFPEIASGLVNGAFRGVQYGWITHIQVAKLFTGAGLGRFMWLMTDKVINTLSSALYSETAVHVFADAAGWGQALLRTVHAQNLLQVGEKLWLYLVR